MAQTSSKELIAFLEGKLQQVEAEGDGPDQVARQKLEDLKRQLGALDDARARVDEPSTESGDQVIAQSISRIAGQLSNIEQRLEEVDDSTSELLADSTKAWLQQQESQPSHASAANGHRKE